MVFVWKVLEMFVRGSLWARVLLLKSRWGQQITFFSWKASLHHLVWLYFRQTLYSVWFAELLLLLREFLQHSACLYFQRIVFQDWDYFDLAVSHFDFVLSDLFLTVCRTAKHDSGVQKQCLFLFTESSHGATVFVLLVWTPLWISTCNHANANAASERGVLMDYVHGR